ncbi:MAG: hypothetical protein MRZ79_21485 [Bacteroidia bacterium]|nr:hypothetical protein [Bacteroidia bacterium]
MKKRIWIYLIGMLILPAIGKAQAFKPESKISLSLKDSSEWVLISRGDNPQAYYYYPAKLRLSVNKRGREEMSFLEIRKSTNPKDSSLQAGILHFLLSWDLSPRQIMELDTAVKHQINKHAMLWGSIPLQTDETDPAVEISATKANEYVNVLVKSLRASSQIPTHPGGKWAASFQFEAKEAEKVREAFNDPALWGDGAIHWKYYFQELQEELTLSIALSEFLRK